MYTQLQTPLTKFYVTHLRYVLFVSFFFAFSLINLNLFGQRNIFENIWTDINENSLNINPEDRQIIPTAYRTVSIDFDLLKSVLSTAPREGEMPVLNSNLAIRFPLPYGGYIDIALVESPIMAPQLAAKFPEIKTFLGRGFNQNSSGRFDITPAGFHGIIFTTDGTIYIDPYSKGNTQNYIVYYKKDFYSSQSFECMLLDTDSPIAEEIRDIVNSGMKSTIIGEQLRTYRLAVAATGEYTTFHGGTVALGMAAIVTAVNRVDGVYEKEIAVRMVLIPNNDLIVYTNASTDPYTNSNGSQMLSQNINNLSSVIGNSNFDIGHVFSTGGGGVAYLGCVCGSSKAGGVTGLSSPIGDPFYIDYVAHEMGHQFGGNHTFNGNAGSCSGSNRNAATAYEPGSGTTIMAYAGICSPQNIQNNSDPYFHGISIDEMVAYTTLSNGNSCPVITSTGNNAPVVNAGTSGLTIPKNTPFTLTGSATDPDNDVLTYCWEEFDLGPAGHPNSPSGNAPIFRSFNPVSTPSRTFPKLSDILNNTQVLGEILPSYARTMNFRLTARDNKMGGGGVGKASITVTVTDAAGPFLVTSPNTAVIWEGNSNQTITWVVANTNVSPVNCTNVNILLSTDGGQTFPIVLASNTPNDGSEIVTIPSNQTTTARIKVEAVGNVFFDLSNTNFTIDAPIPVELTSFNHTINGNNVTLIWNTATETNNYGFEIEKRNSEGNSTWTKIGFVQSSGNSTVPREYSFTDSKLKTGSYSYRLRIVDLDGKFAYSNEINVEIESPASFSLLQNYPNPFNPSTIIKYKTPVSGNISLIIYDVLGNEVETLVNEFKVAGEYEIEFSNANLTSGVYYYQFRTPTFAETKKMMLLK